MCRVPAGPPPAAVYEAPTWLDDGAGEGDGRGGAAPALLPAADAADLAALPVDAEAALLDQLLLGPPIKEEPEAKPVVPVAAQPAPAAHLPAAAPGTDLHASKAFTSAPPAPPPAGFLAGMFAGVPGLGAYPAGAGITHAAAAELAVAARAPKRVSFGKLVGTSFWRRRLLHGMRRLGEGAVPVSDRARVAGAWPVWPHVS